MLSSGDQRWSHAEGAVAMQPVTLLPVEPHTEAVILHANLRKSNRTLQWGVSVTVLIVGNKVVNSVVWFEAKSRAAAIWMRVSSEP